MNGNVSEGAQNVLKSAEEGKKPSTRNSNIDVLKFIAAFFVMTGHMGYICGGQVPSVLYTQLQTLGVYILFSLSGALIVKSWCSDPHPIRYACKRFFRIFPPLIVFTLVMAFIVGPILSSLSFNEYFHSGFQIYLKNILLFPIYSLPGVFANVPYANVVNGSLWTIPVEVFMYCIIPIVIQIVGYKKESKKANGILMLFVVMVCVMDVYIRTLPERPSLVIWGTDWVQAMDIIPFYCIGMLFASPAFKKYLNTGIAVLGLALALCVTPSQIGYRIMLYVLIPYCCFSFAEAKPIFGIEMNFQHEISYGIYLYGFFVQQLVVHLFKNVLEINLTQNLYLLISVVLTCQLALLSEKYVEKPALRLSKKICGKLSQSQGKN